MTGNIKEASLECVPLYHGKRTRLDLLMICNEYMPMFGILQPLKLDSDKRNSTGKPVARI